jgi:hypothetical protein
VRLGGRFRPFSAFGGPGVRRTLHLIEVAFGLSAESLSADDFAELSPALSLGEWLPAALADLTGAVMNLLRPKDAKLVRRDELLDAWGLYAQASEYRAAVSAHEKLLTQANLQAYFTKLRKKSNG